MDTKMKSKPQSKMTSPTRLTASDTRKSVHQKPHLLMKKKDSIVDKDDLVGQVTPTPLGLSLDGDNLSKTKPNDQLKKPVVQLKSKPSPRPSQTRPPGSQLKKTQPAKVTTPVFRSNATKPTSSKVKSQRGKSAPSSNFSSSSTEVETDSESVGVGLVFSESLQAEELSEHSLDGDILDAQPLTRPLVPMAPPLITQIPHKESWPNTPVLIRWSSGACPVKLSSAEHEDIDPLDALPVNSTPIHFETSLFKGNAVFRIARVQSDNTSDTATYFENRRRTLQICIQGKFKRRICFDNVYSGQEFARPLRRVPAKRLVKWAFSLLRSRLPEAFVADLFGPLPYFLAPLVLAAKVVRADSEDACPDVADHDILEEMSHHGVKSVKLDPILLHPDINSGHTQRAQRKHESKIKKAKQKAATEAIKQRKRDLGRPQLLSQQFYELDKTYTFDYYDSFFRADSFCLDLGVKHLDLCPIVGEQPVVSSMAKAMDSGEYLWKFEMWNERTIPTNSDVFRDT